MKLTMRSFEKMLECCALQCSVFTTAAACVGRVGISTVFLHRIPSLYDLN